MKRRLVSGLAVATAMIATGALSAAPATAAQSKTKGLTAHGQLIRPVNTNTSDNWFGYNQGSLEVGDKLFNSISGDWTVPKAKQHTKGQAEYSSDWIGIGGGCVDSSCEVTDETLIQDGTEQDVASTGAPSYSAWWEVLPGPSLTISMTVKPGDKMSSSITEVKNEPDEVWEITLKDLTRNETFTQKVPYPSTHLTAEWIEETPLVIGTSGTGLAALPNLTTPAFSDAMVNGAPADLTSSERIDLVNSSGKVIGAASAPKDNAFNDCAWATTCSAP